MAAQKPDTTDSLELAIWHLGVDDLPLRPVQRFTLNVILGEARMWRDEVLALREKLAELQSIVDSSISGLDSESR